MIYDQLIEMGFGKLKVEKAIKSTNNEGLQSAIDWLISHEMDDEDCIDNNVEENCTATTTKKNEIADDNNLEGDNSSTVAKSLKCEDCGKLLKENEIQFHASRFGHSNFSESVEEIKPLTEEEKKAQLEKLQERLKQKRLEREAQEAKESLERERFRRKQGKTIIDAKTKFEEEEIKRLAEQKRREKEEDRLYRERLKLQIASDRESRKQQQSQHQQEDQHHYSHQEVPNPVPLYSADKNQSINSSQIKAQAKTILSSCCSSTSSKPKYENCRIQIRHSNGTVVLDTFPADGSLFQVATLFSEKSSLCRAHEVEFRTTMPPKLYSKESMDKSVNELGFCPSIVLMAVIKKNIG